MKKKKKIFALFASVVFGMTLMAGFTSCSDESATALAGTAIGRVLVGIKKRSPGDINVSFSVPKNWVKISDEILEETLGEVITDEDVEYRKKIGWHKSGYAYKNDYNSAIVIVQFNVPKFNETQEKQIKTATDLYNMLDDDNDYDWTRKNLNGTDAIVGTRMGLVGLGTDYLAVKGNTAYMVTTTFADTGTMMPDVISMSITDTIKFNAHGIKDGFFDGLLFPIKWGVHFFNKNVRYFAKVNNGASYIASFVIGIVILLGAVLAIFGNES